MVFRTYSTMLSEADSHKINTHTSIFFPLNCTFDEHLLCVCAYVTSWNAQQVSIIIKYHQCNIIAAAFNMSLSLRPEVIKRWTATLLYLFESHCVPWQFEWLSHLSAPHTKPSVVAASGGSNWSYETEWKPQGKSERRNDRKTASRAEKTQFFERGNRIDVSF